MKEIKRLSFKVSIDPDTNPDKYISDEIEDQMDSNRIKARHVINIMETEKDSIVTVVIYYERKGK